MNTSFESPNTGPLESGKNWGWYHSEGGQAPLTKKALLSLELAWSLSWQRFFQFQYCFQTARYRAFFWDILFPTSTGLEMASHQGLKSKKVSLNREFYYINHHNSGNSFGLLRLMALHFQASWGRKELYTSKESPITCRLKAILKLEESLSWEAPGEF